MKSLNFTSFLRVGVFMVLILLLAQCEQDVFAPNDPNLVTSASKEKPDDGSEETAGNNLSFPVIWSDGFAKTVNGTMEDYSFGGEWWYVWGVDPIDPQAELFSCKPDPNNPEICENGSAPGDGSSTVYKAYVQKDRLNVWQADNFNAEGPLNVDLIDWGDNLESVDWTTRSQVRTEVVLYENLLEPVREYAMRHVDSWGIDEVHGAQATLGDEEIFGPGTQATVYSHNARLTIQKLHVDNLDQIHGKLRWVHKEGWKEIDPGNDLVNDDPLFNMAVYEASDGPGYYNAEINVKGKVIYGYTWNVRTLNEGAGYYRITFSFDNDSPVDLNTFFDGSTEIIVPLEEEEIEFVTKEEGSGGGATGVIDVENNLTYMDINIIEKSKGSGGGQGSGNGGGDKGQGGRGSSGGSGSGNGNGNGSGSGSGSGSGNH
jgi:hypothetical protein